MKNNMQDKMSQKEKIIEIYKKEDVARIFDNDRSKYSYQKYKHKIESRFLIKTISDTPSEEINILDVACGTGRMLPDVFNTNKKITYAGLDTSNQMLNELKKKEVYSKNKKRIKLILSDAEKLRFKNNTFDIVYTYHLLWHIPEKEQETIIREMLRVTKKGGVIIFDILNKDFVWENLKEYVGKKKMDGLYKQRISRIKDVLSDVDEIKIEKLSDAIIKNDLSYSFFNIINRFRVFLPPSFFHMIYFKVKK